VGGRVKVVYLSQPTFFRTLARKVAGFFLLVVLASCGGGSSNDSGGTTATQLQGFYEASDSVDSASFISIILPTINGIATWYGWHSKGIVGPHLYKGELTIGVNGAAQSAGAVIKVDAVGTLGTRSATFSQASLNSFQAIISNHVLNTSFNLTGVAKPILAPTFAGTWSGKWFTGLSATGTVNLQFNVSNIGTIGTIFSCTNPSLRLDNTYGGSVFEATIVFPGETGCNWAPTNGVLKTLKGVGFIHTVAGNKRLELMLLDTDGSGISFRGDM
jgi:hypothetical protein